MVNTGTAAARGGLREIRDVRGQRLWVYRSSARAACGSHDGCCLPSCLCCMARYNYNGKRRRKKYARTRQVCLPSQRYSTGSLWIRGTRGFETNFRIAKRRDRDGYGNCRLYRAGREYNSFRSYVTSFHLALDYLQHRPSIVLWMLFFFPLVSRQRALSILSILEPSTFRR